MAIIVSHGSPQTIWVPVKESTSIYVGGLVCTGINAIDEGVIVLPDSTGVSDVSAHNVILGVVIGTNRKEPLFNTTELAEYITAPVAADPHDGASIDYVGVEGPWSKGEGVPMVKVALITSSTVLKANLWATDAGTPLVVMTATAADTNGTAVTTNAGDFTNVANLGTIYARSGANAGCYRQRTDADTGASSATWDWAMPKDIAAGDTFVSVPVRCFGWSTVTFDHTTASWIDCDDEAVLNGASTYAINVVRLDLREAGKEFVEFMFQPQHFSAFITSAATA